MKNILKLSLVLCLMGAGVYSCTEANAKYYHDEATKCIGSKPCSVGHVKIVITANTVTAVANVACVVEIKSLMNRDKYV